MGLCGAQGSGKSTVTELIKTVLTVSFNLKVASFSIDDIYKTKEDRKQNYAEKNLVILARF